jgi:CRP-like cAMP-binding protein
MQRAMTAPQPAACALTETDLALIARSPLLRALSEADRAALLPTAPVATLTRGQVLFLEGEPAAAMFLILTGQMKLARQLEDGREAVIHVLAAGESFAEAAMFLGGRYPVTATAIADARVLRIESGAIKGLITREPQLAFGMLAAMSQHLKHLVAQLEAMKALSGEERLVQFLLALCPLPEGPATFDLPHDKLLIAQRLGMEPETLSRALARLKPSGVTVSGARVAIEDVARLRARAPWIG